MANCSVCKKRRSPNARFCPYCGAPAESETASADELPPQLQGPQARFQGQGRFTPPDAGCMSAAVAGRYPAAPITPPALMPARTAVVTAASLTLLALGAGAFAFSAFLVVATIAFRGSAGTLLYFIPAPYSEALLANAAALIMEFTALVLASLYAVAGTWLLRSSLKGGVLGAALAAISISTALSLLTLTSLMGIPLSWGFGGLVGLWLAVHLLILLALLLGWDTLRS